MIANRFTQRLIPLSLVILAVLLSACAARTPSPIRINELARYTVQVVVTCPDGEGSQGSGVIISPNGDVLTAYHVISQTVRQTGCRIQLGQSKDAETPPVLLYEARLLDRDPVMDVAVLRITSSRDGRPPATPLPYAPMADALPPIGSQIQIMGFPGLTDQLLAYDQDTIISEGECQTAETCWILTEAFASWGSSGGPAFDAQGRVIGLATGSRVITWRGETHRLTAIRPLPPIRRLVDRALQQTASLKTEQQESASRPIRLWQVEVVGPQGVNWRTEPSTKRGLTTVKATLPKGTILDVIPPGNWQGWWATVDPMGEMGWMKERTASVTLLSPRTIEVSPQLTAGRDAIVTCLTQSPCAQVIYSPGYGGEEADATLGYLAGGDQVTILEGPVWVNELAWWRVQRGELDGWLPEITDQGYRLLLPVPELQP